MEGFTKFFERKRLRKSAKKLLHEATKTNMDFSKFTNIFIIINIIIIIIIIIITIELSLGGNSPYTNTDKTNKNKYT